MYDYGRLVFLDNQKTGGTYVSVFLDACCTLSQIEEVNAKTGKIRDLKHHPVRNAYQPEAIYFSTVRNPVDLYTSLFQYGRENRGITFKRIRALGRLDLYDNLPRWLDFVLDEANASIFREDYEQFAPLGIGLMSFRTMRITLAHPVSVMQKATSYEHMIRLWARHNIAKHIFRQETLNHSLRRFASETYPEFFDQAAVSAFFARTGRVNATSPQERLAIPKEQMLRIRAKERFLFEEFYAPPFDPRTWWRKMRQSKRNYQS